MSAVVSADDRDEYENNEREEIEMGSAIEENEASYLDEADVADDCSTFKLVSFMAHQAKLVHLPHGNNAADVWPTVEKFSLGGSEARRIVVQQRLNGMLEISSFL